MLAHSTKHTPVDIATLSIRGLHEDAEEKMHATRNRKYRQRVIAILLAANVNPAGFIAATDGIQWVDNIFTPPLAPDVLSAAIAADIGIYRLIAKLFTSITSARVVFKDKRARALALESSARRPTIITCHAAPPSVIIYCDDCARVGKIVTGIDYCGVLNTELSKCMHAPARVIVNEAYVNGTLRLQVRVQSPDGDAKLLSVRVVPEIVTNKPLLPTMMRVTV